MYHKDLDRWNELKKKIDSYPADNVPYFHEREIWFCSIGHNVGFEQDGKDA
jgi:hypothetical protein